MISESKQITDEDREMQIDIAYLKFATGKTVNARKESWEKMNMLIKNRSPEKIREMEEKQGLLD